MACVYGKYKRFLSIVFLSLVSFVCVHATEEKSEEKLYSTVAQHIGNRPTQQDAYFKERFFSKDRVRSYAMMCVLDGHGQDKNCQNLLSSVKNIFLDLLKTSLQEENPNIPKILRDTFIQTDKKICDEYNAFLTKSLNKITDENQKELYKIMPGTTVVLSLLDEQTNQMYIANLGDSRAIVFSKKTGKELFKTVDHCHKNQAEKKRVETEEGKFVGQNLTHVVLASAQDSSGAVESTGSLGDVHVKKRGEDGTSYPIRCTPDIYQFTLKPDHFVMLATDGCTKEIDSPEYPERHLGFLWNDIKDLSDEEFTSKYEFFAGGYVNGKLDDQKYKPLVVQDQDLLTSEHNSQLLSQCAKRVIYLLRWCAGNEGVMDNVTTAFLSLNAELPVSCQYEHTLKGAAFAASLHDTPSLQVKLWIDKEIQDENVNPKPKPQPGPSPVKPLKVVKKSPSLSKHWFIVGGVGTLAVLVTGWYYFFYRK